MDYVDMAQVFIRLLRIDYVRIFVHTNIYKLYYFLAFDYVVLCLAIVANPCRSLSNDVHLNPQLRNEIRKRGFEMKLVWWFLVNIWAI